MVAVDLFCTGAYTEIGGLREFLRRALAADRDDVDVGLRFPAVEKPGPKVAAPGPRARHAGTTGRGLEQKMMLRS